MTETPSQPDEAGPAGVQTLDPVRLVWDALTSPVTFMLSASTFGLLLALGTYIDQGLTEGELLEQRTFAGAQALLGLGFTDLLTSWVVWFVGLVLTLNVVGLVLRHVWLTPPDARGWGGPSVDHATCTTTASLEAVTASMGGRMGRTSRSSGLLVARAGFWTEGLVIVAIGVLVLMGSVAVDRSVGIEARLEVLGSGAPPSQEEPGPLVVRFLEEGAWIDRQLPFTARCADTSLADPARGWRCTLTRKVPATADAPPSTEEEQIQLGPGWPDAAFGLTFHVANERPLPGRSDFVRLVDAAGQLVYAGPPRRTASLPGGEQLTPFAGPDGPLVVVTPPGAAPYLLAPSTDVDAAPAKVGSATLSSAPPWQLTLGASRRPGSALAWTGLGLLLLGFLVLAALPHLTVTAREVDGEVTLRAWSFNRADVAERALASLGGAA
jgi:hypothetical protein